MSKEFTLTENGYDPIEVDKYIEMIQVEYNNAIAWGEQNEAKYEKMKADLEAQGVYFTIEEDNQNEVIEKIFSELKSTVARITAEAEKKAQDIIEAANEKSKGIVRQAMEHSIELRTENSTIMKNLESINKMIEVILEKGTH